MRHATHRIRSQRWQVRTSSQEDAFAWRGYLSDNNLLPVLEKAFDEVSPGEEALYVPRIELKLKLPPDQQAFEALPGLIYRQAREQLRSHLQESVSSTGELHGPSRDKPATRLDTLFQYLRTGIVPWHAVESSASEMSFELMETCSEEWSRVLDHVQNFPEHAFFYFRLLDLVSEAKQRDLMSLLTERLPEQLRTAAGQFLEHLLGSAGARFSRHVRLRLAAGAVSKMLQIGKNMRHQQLFSLLENTVPPNERAAIDNFISALPEAVQALFLGKGANGNSSHETAPAVIVQEALKMRDSPGSIQTEAGANRTGDDNPDIYQKKQKESRATQIDGIVPASASHDRSEEDLYPDNERPSDDVYPLLVHQAGLLLLNPYIPRLFEKTGITHAEKRQIPSCALARAAALLHFLATGRADVYEYELGLIKVLLGLRPETVLLVCDGLIEAGDRAEAETLLVSVIRHWPALKNTSPEGLRASFLERPALLREKAKSWNLKVERRPYDILIGQLPWSIAFLKLPWMKQSISIEW